MQPSSHGPAPPGGGTRSRTTFRNRRGRGLVRGRHAPLLRGPPRPLVLALALAFAATACRSEDSDEPAPELEVPLFTRLPSSETGVTFANALEADPVMNGFTYEYYYNGGGVAVGDLDGDGLPDLYFSGNRVPNRLFLNLGGLRFRDVTRESGVVGHTGWATGVTLTDVNADGRLDIYVSYSGAYEDPDLRRNLLFVNQGVRDGVPVFAEEGAARGLDARSLSTQAAFFDCDGDGDLDMYLMNHGVAGYETLAELKAGHSPLQMDRLYRNDGGRYVDIGSGAGIQDTNLGFGLGLTVSDFDRDGRADIYVANDYSGRDYLYMGRPGCHFEDVLPRAMGHIPFASMGSDAADVDGDGWLDLMVLEMAMPTHYERTTSENGATGERFANVVAEGQHLQYVSNALQWNRGTDDEGVPIFSEIAPLAGVDRTDWSWSALFADLDDDGRPDLFVTTGTPSDMVNKDFQAWREKRVEEVLAESGRVTHSLMLELLDSLPHRLVPNRVFRNEGGLSFRERAASWGLGGPTYSNGAAYADLDRDGDLDLVVNDLMDEASIYRNEGREKGLGGHWLGVAFQGLEGNPWGVGATVRLWAGGQLQLQELQLTRGYQSSVEPVLHFGLGSSGDVDSLQVTWPDGARETRTDVTADRYLTLRHQDAEEGPPGSRGPERGARPALFDEATGALRPAPRHRATFRTTDTVLRPYPSWRDRVAMAVGDLDGDGRDDFVFGASGGSPSRIWFREADGTFRAGDPLPEAGPEVRDVTAAAVLDADGDGRLDVWLAAGGAGTAHHRLLLNAGGRRFRPAPAGAVPDVADAGAVLAPGDADADGDQDLFVGGYAVPGTTPVSSHLLRNDGGVFRDVTTDAAPALLDLGQVNDALWADLDGDDADDLVVVGEWMAPTVLDGGGEVLRDVTAEVGLEGLEGWWQSVAAADLDGDGDLDLVAGNMGLDHPYHPTPETPFELRVGDFDGDSDLEAVPGYWEDGRLYPWSDLASSLAQLPSLAERYPTNDAYARATLDDLLGPDDGSRGRRLRAGTFATTLLENRGPEGFRSRALPSPAQVSPVRGIVVSDFDGDGALDLVVAGNLYEMGSRVPRADAGVGLFLRGDGAGRFEPVNAAVSGLLLPGRVAGLLGVATGSGTGSTTDLLVGVAGGEARYVRARPSGDAGGDPRRE